MAAMSEMQQLRVLDLRGTDVGDDGMVHLAKLKNLRDLDLSETIVGNAGLEPLKSLPKLEKLNLWATRVGDAGMVHIAAMRPLKWLNLDDVRFLDDEVYLTDKGLEQVVKLPNLEWLHVGKTQVSDAGLKLLAGLKKLKHLEVTHCERVTPAGIDELRKALPGLEVVF
jgi:hypothetical protein